jgi:hypothetical protein
MMTQQMLQNEYLNLAWIMLPNRMEVQDFIGMSTLQVLFDVSCVFIHQFVGC